MITVAIFGPTAVGKTGVAIALAEALRERGEDPVAINCDAMQVYRGLELVSAAPDEGELGRLEHRLLGFVDVTEEFSAGRFAPLAHTEIDAALAAGRRPLVVGGTGLYLRAALAELELRPPVPTAVREQVERELTERGLEALHAELEPALRTAVHSNDRKRIARYLELQRAGIEPPRGSEQLWTAKLRHPTLLAGLVTEREALQERIETRLEAMLAAGAAEQARRALAGRAAAEQACRTPVDRATGETVVGGRVADAAGISRTAAQMIGLEALAAGDVERALIEHRQYARRQLTWMRKMAGGEPIDRTGRTDTEVAAELLARLDTPADALR